MNDYCVDLNVKLTPLIKDVNTYKTIWHQRIPLGDLHPELVQFLMQHGVKIGLAELFYTSPGGVIPIHIDNAGGNYTKLNFIWGGDQSCMCWYSANPGVVKTAAASTIGTRYVGFDHSEVTEVHRQSVKFPSIVQVGVPHNIINPLTPRWCLSIVLMQESGKRITMAKTVELFKDVIG